MWPKQWSLIGLVGLLLAMIVFVILRRSTFFTSSTIPFKSILIVTAHPDDECMFFAPFILSALAQGVTVNLFCLSHGEAGLPPSPSLPPPSSKPGNKKKQGRNNVRVKELKEATMVLGIHWHMAISDLELPDGMHKEWPIEKVQSLVSVLAQESQIEAIVTFDKHGISGHANHRSLAKLKTVYRNSKGMKNVQVWHLETVSMLKKYCPLFTIFEIFKQTKRSSDNHKHSMLRFVIGWKQYLVAIKAMVKHRSQLTWYRLLYLIFSRYMWVNTLFLNIEEHDTVG